MHEYLLTFDGISVAIGNDCIYMWINSKRCNVCESAGCHRTHINDAHYSTQILFHRFFISFFFSLLLQSHSFWLKQDTCTMLIEIYGGCAPPAAGGNLFDNVLHWRVAEYIFYKTISIKCYTVCVVLYGGAMPFHLWKCLLHLQNRQKLHEMRFSLAKSLSAT